MSWWIFGLGILGSGVVGYFIGKRFGKGKFKPRTARTRTDKDLGLKGDEKRIYDILDKGDGVGYFSKIAEEHGIGRSELEGIVKSLVGMGLLRDKVFSYRRKLCLVGYLNARERKVLEFVKGKGGEADVSLIMEKCGPDYHKLIPMGKKFVRMGLIVKIRRGYKTFFVLTKKG